VRAPHTCRNCKLPLVALVHQQQRLGPPPHHLGGLDFDRLALFEARIELHTIDCGAWSIRVQVQSRTSTGEALAEHQNNKNTGAAPLPTAHDKGRRALPTAGCSSGVGALARAWPHTRVSCPDPSPPSPWCRDVGPTSVVQQAGVGYQRRHAPFLKDWRAQCHQLLHNGDLGLHPRAQHPILQP
jgi:hypothetical protein